MDHHKTQPKWTLAVNQFPQMPISNTVSNWTIINVIKWDFQLIFAWKLAFSIFSVSIETKQKLQSVKSVEMISLISCYWCRGGGVGRLTVARNNHSIAPRHTEPRCRLPATKINTQKVLFLHSAAKINSTFPPLKACITCDIIFHIPVLAPSAKLPSRQTN